MNKVNKILLNKYIIEKDWIYSAQLLLNKNYFLFVLKKLSSSYNTKRIDLLYQDP